jgi:hypothetical protein
MILFWIFLFIFYKIHDYKKKGPRNIGPFLINF